jgi:RHS repeat-associated protein
VDYTFEITSGAKSFSFDGRQYGPADQFSGNDACQVKAFVAAYRAANPNLGVKISARTMDMLDAECPAVFAVAVPQPSSGLPPVEGDPKVLGGDSAANQGAPSPATGGNLTGTATTPTTAAPPGDEPRRPPKQEPHPTNTGDKAQNPTGAADPVDLFSGAFTLEEVDLSIPNTLLPLTFVRIYRSGTPSFGALGWNWDHNFNLYVRELNSGDIGLWRALREERFTRNGNEFEPPRGVFETLERVAGLPQVFELTGAGGQVLRFERPMGWNDGERVPLLSIADRHGNCVNLSYDNEDRVAQVRDTDDRFFSFDYDHCGLLVAVTDHAGRRYEYEHDEERMQLILARSPGIADYPQGINRRYDYALSSELPEIRYNIVRVIDHDENVYLENEYDTDPSSWSYARVLRQFLGGYLFQFCYELLQGVPRDPVFVNIPATRVQVLSPELGLETYTFNFRGDLLDRRYRLNKDKSFRIAAWMYEYDGQGNLIAVTQPDGSQQLATYQAGHADPRVRGLMIRMEVTSASGFPASGRIVWKGTHEQTFQLLSEEENENGAVTQYLYDFDITPGSPTNSGRLLKQVEPEATLPDGTVQKAITLFERNSAGLLTAMVQPDGVRTLFVYGAAGAERNRLVKVIDDAGGLGATRTIAYDNFGFDRLREDANGNTTTYEFNALGLIERVILPPVNGETAEYRTHYNADHKVVSVERPRGTYSDPLLGGNPLVDRFEHDVIGYPTLYHFVGNTQMGRRLGLSCDFRGLPVEILSPDRSQLRRTLDERGLLCREELLGADGTQAVSTTAFDRMGNVRRHSSTFGEVTEHTYDGFSRPAKITLPNQSEVHYQWLPGDLLASEEVIGDDGSGTLRQLSWKGFEYDEKGRRISETNRVFTDDPTTAVAVTTVFFHDARDRVVRIIDHRGGITTIAFDGLGRENARSDPLGNVEHRVHDLVGNLVVVESHQREPDGAVSVHKRTFAYDARNRRTQSIAPDGATLTEVHDDRNLVVRDINYLGIERHTDFDPFGNRVREVQDVNGLALTQQWTFDAMSRVVTYTDPTGQTSTYTRDGLGRLLRAELANGFSSARTYGASGQLIRETLGSGAVFEYAYDAACRIVEVANPVAPAPMAALMPHRLRYDGQDRMIGASVGAQQVERAFDSLGRLVRERSGGIALRRTFDDAAGVFRKTWPDGRTEAHFQDLNAALSRVEQTAPGSVGKANAILATFARSGAHFIGAATYGAGLALRNSFDERKRLIECRLKTASDVEYLFKYLYDCGNRRRVEAIEGPQAQLSAIDFDTRNRLVSVRDGFDAAVPNALTQAQHDLAIADVIAAAAAARHREAFTYDGADARLKHTESGQPDETYTYRTGHRIQDDGGRSYTHHPDGTLRTAGNTSFDVDALGRVVRIRTPTATLCEIAYDPLGRPAIVRQGTHPPRTLHYFDRFVEQETDGGALVAQFTRHSDTGVLIARHGPGQCLFPIFDARYNQIAVADDSGALLETCRYRPFGAPSQFNSAGQPVATSTLGMDPIFGGQRYLPEVGLYLCDRRLLDPRTGLFLSGDPHEYADSPSLYVYAAQNPIDLIDPSGELAFVGVLVVMGIGALVAGGVNAARQGVQIAEGSRRDGLSGWELLESTIMGAIIAPAVVFAPELGIGLAAAGVHGGIEEMRQGHYMTGTFDIVTSLIPILTKGGRSTTLGRGTVFRGIDQAASRSTRAGRFQLIGAAAGNVLPAASGRDVGVGWAPMVRPGQTHEGHVAVVIEGPTGKPTFFEKNARRIGSLLLADFRVLDELPAEYYPDPRAGRRPFEYSRLRVSKANADNAFNYARQRTAEVEPFDFNSANCACFASDVLGQAGFRGFGNGRSAGAVWGDFQNFADARTIVLTPRPSVWRFPNDWVASK